MKEKIEDYTLEAINSRCSGMNSVREYKVDKVYIQGREVISISYWTGVGIGDPKVAVTGSIGAVGTATAALVAASSTAATAAAATATASTLAAAAMAAEGATLISASTASVAATNTAAAAIMTASTAAVVAWVVIPVSVAGIATLAGGAIYNGLQDWKYAYFDEKTKEYLGKNQNEVKQNLSGEGEELCYYNPFEYDSYFNKYYSESIDSILKLRLKEISKQDDIGLVPAGYVFDDLKDSVEFGEIATKIVTMDQNVIFLPYNQDGKHWVGIVFEKDDQNVIKLTYINTDGNIIPDVLENGIRVAFKELGYSINSFDMFIVEKQLTNNCGPQLIEAFLQILTGYKIPQANVVPHHSKLVEMELCTWNDSISQIYLLGNEKELYEVES